jgi:hypothetical protein
MAKKWFANADPRNLVYFLQKFLVYNADALRFLGIDSVVVGTDTGAGLSFRSSSFIGAVPLRSPSTGKQIGDFVVSPRFVGRHRLGEYIEILDLLGGDISPEFRDGQNLASGRIFRPPFYLEAVKFISSLEAMLRVAWRKFDTSDEISKLPIGVIKWGEYVRNDYKVENKLRYPTRRNILSEFHQEFGEIRFVFDMCKEELSSNTTPYRIRNLFRSRLAVIERRLYLHKPRRVKRVEIRAADPMVLKTCKRQANRILDHDLNDGTAWRVDFNDVFEKFVQYVLRKVAHSMGATLFPNPHILARTHRRYAWELSRLEPDAVLKKGNWSVAIDAKYKSHLFNKFDAGEVLREDYRRDLHQLLAYAAFGEEPEKLALLCYPSNSLEAKTTRFETSLSHGTASVLLLGIPLNRENVNEIVREVAAIISRKIEREPSSSSAGELPAAVDKHGESA